MTTEWGDRQNVLEKWRKRRLWIISLTIVCFAVLTLAAARKNFVNTFYSFLTFTFFVPFLIMLAEKRMRSRTVTRGCPGLNFKIRLFKWKKYRLI